MPQPTIKYTLDRLRRGVKGLHPDAHLTDRYLYSLYKKHGSLLMRRQDSTNKLLRFNSVFQTLEHLPLVQVPLATVGSVALSDELISRTRDPLPAMHEGYWGPLLRTVSSLDRSVRLQPTYPEAYQNLTQRSNFKHNRTQYYWYMDGHLFLPRLYWKALKVEGVYEGDVSHINRGEPYCDYFQSQPCNIPEFLYTEIEDLVRQELSGIPSLPTDKANDNANILS